MEEAKEAIQEDSNERLAAILAESFDSSPNVDLEELWWEAVNLGRVECMRVLLDNGASCNSRDGLSWTALHRVAEDNNTLAMELLIEAGADLEATNLHQRTPLHMAVRNGSEACARMLQEEGADMWFEDCNGCAPIVYSTHHIGILRIMVAAMQNSEFSVPNEVQKRQLNKAVLHATLSERRNSLALLLEAGADPNAYDGRPLNSALMRGNSEIVRTLLEGGARPWRCIFNVLRPLFVAVFRGHVECVKLLLEYGVDVNETHVNGDTALVTATREGQTTMLEYLIDHGASVNHQGGHGQTALHHAAYMGHISSMEILICAGGDPNITSDDNSLPLHHILSQTRPLTKDHLRCLALLIRQGSSLDERCVDSIYPSVPFTPLVLAWWHQHLNAIDILLKAGSVMPQHCPASLVAAFKRAFRKNDLVEEQLLEQIAKISIVPELQCLCRNSIRNVFGGQNDSLHKLPLPIPLVEYLEFADLDVL